MILQDAYSHGRQSQRAGFFLLLLCLTSVVVHFEQLQHQSTLQKHTPATYEFFRPIFRKCALSGAQL